MNVQELLLTTFSLLSSLFIVCIVVCIGWYLVWKIFLSRFKLVRELLGLINETSPSSVSAGSEKDITKKTPKSRKIRKD